MSTKYPIVLVHGLAGFNEIVGFPYFYGIADALRQDGHQVFTASLSAFNSNEVRGKQLWQFVQTLLQETQAKKVNFIGHSQGPLACRYVAANYPDSVASVTSINGVNHGSEIADLYRRIMRKDSIPEYIVEKVLNAFGTIISTFSGHRGDPQDAIAALESLTTEQITEFNNKYPQALPKTPGGEGDEIVNGVHYYCFGSYIQGLIAGEKGNLLDPTHAAMRVLNTFFTEKQNDGLVGRSSMRLGKLIKDDYAQDHIDMVNQVAGLVGYNEDIVAIYTQHAKYLASKQL
ncbi:lipase family alpha/beta hydrolase [Proteus mirabilis]|uniref:lipase family alpha/beta hydrolase n=1 Tax=Proteus mirabilis TaxID=584 RepID=UPI00128EFF4A|nr:triacylglycerol lipase [Proteus mirabilis]EKW4024050.1 triacylglycerol lipase [Proteus mirabilis]EMC9358660.1 triacylglycerol lipase [Proteus mirabilis]EMD6179318.1 triacylglycerol lipase [Proteus mirabilis]MBB6662280.1 triacylglycerol lipase [Proteus mirabilis]MBB6705594.1 triacylglycerol lipase [Proteus mirabilis]